MRPKQGLLIGLLICVISWAGCGGSMNNVTTNPLPTSRASTVTLTMGDTPPAGVTILSFELTVNGAQLNPHDPTHTAPQLLTKPVDIQVTSLEIEKAFLNTSNIPPDTYDSITVTFSNPEMTIMNTSGAPIAGCADGAVCKLEPAINPAMVTFSATPFPLMLGGNSQAGLLLDFNLNDSIQGDLTVNPVVSFTQLALLQPQNEQEKEPEQEMEEIDDVVGQITGVDASNNKFTLFLPRTGQSLAIQVNPDTQFEKFEEAGLQGDFSALAMGQIVEVDLELMTGGSMVAKKIELRQPANEVEEESEGTITSVDSATQFKMVVVENTEVNGLLQVGSEVTVTIQDGAQFSIDNDGLSVPSNLIFASAADLLVGQTVDVRALSGSTGTSAITDRVRLRKSQFTAQISAINGSDITVNSLPGLFTSANPPVTEIIVQTSAETNFEDVSGLIGLAVGNTISLRGLLFKTSGDPVLLADTVRLR